jgi:transposase
MILQIDQCLEQNRQKRQGGKHKQVMKKVDIWEWLNKEGHEIGYTTVCNYVRGQEHRQETYIRQHYEPGQVCEFDWGEVKLEINGSRQVCQMAVFTLAKSNYRYAVLYLRQDSQSFQQSHVSFFEHLGGVPAQLVYDNMRVAVRRFVGRTEKEATEALLGMSMYYQFDFRFCNVGKGNEKGHVERSVEYVRRKAFSGQDEFERIGAANVHLQAVLDGLNAREQKEKGASAQALLQAELPHLGACPAVAMECASWVSCRVDKYSTFCVGTNRYSAPEELTGKMVDIKVFSDRVDLYHERQFLYSHERKHSRYTWSVHPSGALLVGPVVQTWRFTVFRSLATGRAGFEKPL